MFVAVSSPLLSPTQLDTWAQLITNSDSSCAFALSLKGNQSTVAGEHLSELCRSCHAQSALELHQCIQEVFAQAAQWNCSVAVAACLFIDNRSVLCVYQGSIFLHRQTKVGKILTAEDELKVIEGSLKPDDVFVLVAGVGTQLDAQVITAIQHSHDDEEFVDELNPSIAPFQGEKQVIVARITVQLKSPVVAAAPTTPMSTTAPSLGTATASDMSAVAKPPALKVIVRKTRRLVRKLQQLGRETFATVFSQDVYVRRRTTKQVMRVVVPVLAILLTAGVFFVIQRNRQKQEVALATTLIAPVETQLTAVKQTVASDPISARKQTEDLITQLEQEVTAQKDHPLTVSLLQQELNRARDFYNSISGQEVLPVLPSYFDLRYIQSDFISNQINMYHDSLLFLDSGKKQIIALDANKKYQLLPVGNLPEVRDFTLDAKNAYLLGDGIYRFPLSASQSTQIKTNDDTLQAAQFIRSFGSYLYVLNKDKRSVYRYAAVDNNTLSAGVSWLKPGENLDFNDINSMAIDGSIWFGMKSGQIKQYTTGKADQFQVVGLKDPFVSPVVIYTNENLQNIYVLEPQKNRLVILSKKGEFIREVKSSNFSSTTAVVADETLHKAYVVSGALVYEVGL